MKIVHVVNTYTVKNPAENARLQRAAWTWQQAYEKQGIFGRHVPTEALPRTSDKELGDSRRLPFIKDMVEYILGWSTPEAVRDVMALPDPLMVRTLRAESDCLIMLTNADTCLCSDIKLALEEGYDYDMGPHDGLFYSHRRNFTRFPKRHLTVESILNRGEPFCGIDMVAFTPAWWAKNRDEYPDLVLGCEGWDWVFKFWPGAKRVTDCVYHEYHYPPYWMANRECPGERHNKRECWKWANRQPHFETILNEWPSMETYASA